MTSLFSTGIAASRLATKHHSAGQILLAVTLQKQSTQATLAGSELGVSNAHSKFYTAQSVQSINMETTGKLHIDSQQEDTATLLARILDLESQLKEQTAKLKALTERNQRSTANGLSQRNRSDPTSSPKPTIRTRSPRRAQPFDPTKYSTRHIALKFAYLGTRYNGFEHANGAVPPRPTIEEVLYKALRKARLISPPIPEGSDMEMDVVWDPEMRKRKYWVGNGCGSGEEMQGKRGNKTRLDLIWEGCQYSKCGRTDRGVSAYGQVVAIRVRSNKPLEKVEGRDGGSRNSIDSMRGADTTTSDGLLDMNLEMSSIDADDLATETYEHKFDPVADELPYVSILNSILPPDIRILAWCPNLPEGFDARFSCRERRYRYFFTNPAFCPTPGPIGMKDAAGRPSDVREGWLDIDRMRIAAKKLVGLHDYRNFCKIDASKQMPSCERRITFADVQEMDEPGKAFLNEGALNSDGKSKSAMLSSLGDALGSLREGPSVYAFEVRGSAFLWHQVRCMVGVLFAIGQGLEKPELVDELLDISKNPGRPQYQMADDAPLVLWDCIFPDESSNGEDALNWIYAGDAQSMPALSTRTDTKFGLGGIVDDLWIQWHKAKMNEILTGRLLDLAISQGDGSAYERGGFRIPELVKARSQRLFDGSPEARVAGEYVAIMDKPKIESLEVLNAKYMALKKRRAQANGDNVADISGD